MPVINIKLAAPMPNKEKCEEIIKDLTEYFETKLGKKRERIVIMLEEIPQSHIGFGGRSVENINNSDFVNNYKLEDR